MRKGSAGRPTCAILVSALGLGVGLLPASAQTLPGVGGADLTLPPEMRAGTAPVPARQPIKHRHADRKVGRSSEPEPSPAHHAPAAPSHPVELGVTMRGGSGTPRVYGATGTSEGIQESGSAFGAGMRFGF